MPGQTGFKGFTKKTVSFFEDLAANNNRIWFERNRDIYETQVMEPAKAFVTAMGARLRSVAPKIVAVPKVNKSIFRINRDTRFSLDPSPYKTNLGIYFWDGMKPRMESSGFYFHLEPPDLMLGAGMYMFPDTMLERYRQAVVHPRQGKDLAAIIKSLSGVKGIELGGEKHYKRIPAGYDPGHPNAPLLLHKGLYAGFETSIPEEFYSEALIDYCFERYRLAAPLHKWIMGVVKQA